MWCSTRLSKSPNLIKTVIDAEKDSEEHPACCRLGTERKGLLLEQDFPGDSYTITKKFLARLTHLPSGLC